MKDKELIWVPKDVAEKFKSFENDVNTGEIVIEFMEKSKKDIGKALEALDDDVLVFKAWSVKVKKAYKEALDAQLSSCYKLFEETDSQIPSIRKEVDKVKNTLDPLKKELDDIEKILSSINTYKMDRLLETISLISRALQDESIKEVLKILINNT